MGNKGSSTQSQQQKAENEDSQQQQVVTSSSTVSANKKLSKSKKSKRNLNKSSKKVTNISSSTSANKKSWYKSSTTSNSNSNSTKKKKKKKNKVKDQQPQQHQRTSSSTDSTPLLLNGEQETQLPLQHSLYNESIIDASSSSLLHTTTTNADTTMTTVGTNSNPSTDGEDEDDTKMTSLFNSSFTDSSTIASHHYNNNNNTSNNNNSIRDFTDPTGLFDLTPLNDHRDDAEIVSKLSNEQISHSFDKEEDRADLENESQPFQSHTLVESDDDNEEEDDHNYKNKDDDDSDLEPRPVIFHGNLPNKDGDDDCHSLSSLLSSCHTEDLESLGNISQEPSLSDLSVCSSIASLNLKRKKTKPRTTYSSSSSSSKFRLTSSSCSSSSSSSSSFRKRSHRHSSSSSSSSYSKSFKIKSHNLKPTAHNAFATLPRHLIKSALVRQATTTLRDSRFISKRILKLGPTEAAKVHVGDLICLHKRSLKDARKREKYVNDYDSDGDNKQSSNMPKLLDANTFKDGEDATSVTLESFDLFQHCVLDLCSVQMVDGCPEEEEEPRDDSPSSSLPEEEQEQEVDNTPSPPPTITPETQPPKQEPQIELSEAGKAIYILGRCVHRKDWLEEAMAYYRYALFLFLVDIGLKEPSLLAGEDCTGFFYLKISNFANGRCSRRHSTTSTTSASANDDATVEKEDDDKDYATSYKDLATILTKMGDVHGKLNEVNDALRSYRASQQFWNLHLQTHPTDINSAIVQNCTNSQDIMEELDDRAAAVEGLALTYNRIGGVWCSKGEIVKARTAFCKAMEMQMDALGENHLEVAKTLHNIGVSYRHDNELDDALEYYKRAHEIFELNLGKEHLDTVRTLHNIGGVYRRQKEYEKAMKCFRDVLQVRRTLLGDGHPSVSITLVSIAAVLRRSGEEKEANKYYCAAMR